MNASLFSFPELRMSLTARAMLEGALYLDRSKTY
jgi:hypothetical protein